MRAILFNKILHATKTLGRHLPHDCHPVQFSLEKLNVAEKNARGNEPLLYAVEKSGNITQNSLRVSSLSPVCLSSLSLCALLVILPLLHALVCALHVIMSLTRIFYRCYMPLYIAYNATSELYFASRHRETSMQQHG